MSGLEQQCWEDHLRSRSPSALSEGLFGKFAISLLFTLPLMFSLMNKELRLLPGNAAAVETYMLKLLLSGMSTCLWAAHKVTH
jgi:hypothetical protein